MSNKPSLLVYYFIHNSPLSFIKCTEIILSLIQHHFCKIQPVPQVTLVPLKLGFVVVPITMSIELFLLMHIKMIFTIYFVRRIENNIVKVWLTFLVRFWVRRGHGYSRGQHGKTFIIIWNDEKVAQKMAASQWLIAL